MTKEERERADYVAVTVKKRGKIREVVLVPVDEDGNWCEHFQDNDEIYRMIESATRDLKREFK